MLMRVFLLLFLFGCNVSYAALFGDDKAREQISALNNQVDEMQTRIAKMEETLKSKGLLRLYTQVETLELELGKLRGQVEVLSNDNALLQKRQKDFYIDLDNRLRRIEDPNAPVVTESSDSATSSATPIQESTVVTEPSSVNNLEPASPVENSVYEVAHNAFKNGDFAGAISQFEIFLENYPKSSLAPSAAYWIGNAHYALRDFQKAIDAQNKLISVYPDSTKIPDALLNIASSQQETVGSKAAKATLKDLIERYPFSDAAEKAKRRLAKRK
tara:strand:- start:278 stop:1093 length:816 start_codon:yes stop_codon:yes gene_type:complete